jgi:hypothetical protein
MHEMPDEPDCAAGVKYRTLFIKEAGWSGLPYSGGLS